MAAIHDTAVAAAVMARDGRCSGFLVTTKLWQLVASAEGSRRGTLRLVSTPSAGGESALRSGDASGGTARYRGGGARRPGA